MPTVDRSFRPDNYWDVLECDRDVHPSRPSWLGGTYLPELLPGEVEIARLEAEGGTRDVVSIRARRRGRDGRILYRVVDEYGTALRYGPRSSRRPLTLERLVALVDSIGSAGGTGGKDSWIEKVVGRSVKFATVASPYYPALREHYGASAA